MEQIIVKIGFDTYRTHLSCCFASNTSQIRRWQHWWPEIWSEDSWAESLPLLCEEQWQKYSWLRISPSVSVPTNLAASAAEQII